MVRVRDALPEGFEPSQDDWHLLRDVWRPKRGGTVQPVPYANFRYLAKAWGGCVRIVPEGDAVYLALDLEAPAPWNMARVLGDLDNDGVVDYGTLLEVLATMREYQWDTWGRRELRAMLPEWSRYDDELVDYMTKVVYQRIHKLPEYIDATGRFDFHNQEVTEYVLEEKAHV